MFISIMSMHAGSLQEALAKNMIEIDMVLEAFKSVNLCKRKQPVETIYDRDWLVVVWIDL